MHCVQVQIPSMDEDEISRNEKAAKEWRLRPLEVLKGAGEEQCYQVKRLLGKGSFGRVYQCRRLRKKKNMDTEVDICEEDDVAIKVQERACANEVSILRRLGQDTGGRRGANVTQILEDFVHRDRVCLVLEMMPTDLWKLLNQQPSGSLSLAHTRMVTRELLLALSWIKQKGVIHADIKLDNILIDPQGPNWRVKLADFGRSIMKYDAVHFKGNLLQVSYFRAPEVIFGAPFTEAIDMWSLGCVSACLFLGIEHYLFPSDRGIVQLHLMVDLLGKPPRQVLREGKHTAFYFARDFRLKAGPAVKRMVEFVKSRRGFLNFDDFPDHDFAMYLRKSLNMDQMQRLQPLEALDLNFFRCHEE